MDYLQYLGKKNSDLAMLINRFKPCYKWITFNTGYKVFVTTHATVLNLVINGLPSILYWRKRTKLSIMF